MATLKFACIPVKFAPKNKITDFALPRFRQKLADLENDPDVLSWVTNVYQERAFPTREAFNKAYDSDTWAVKWANKPMVLKEADISRFEEEFNEGGFDGKPEVYQKLIRRMREVMAKEKIVFVY
jgi:hypothetical protein